MTTLKKDRVPKTAPEGTTMFFRGPDCQVYVGPWLNPRLDRVRVVQGSKTVNHLVDAGSIQSAPDARALLRA